MISPFDFDAENSLVKIKNVNIIWDKAYGIKQITVNWIAVVFFVQIFTKICLNCSFGAHLVKP